MSTKVIKLKTVNNIPGCLLLCEPPHEHLAGYCRATGVSEKPQPLPVGATLRVLVSRSVFQRSGQAAAVRSWSWGLGLKYLEATQTRGVKKENIGLYGTGILFEEPYPTGSRQRDLIGLYKAQTKPHPLNIFKYREATQTRLVKSK